MIGNGKQHHFVFEISTHGSIMRIILLIVLSDFILAGQVLHQETALDENDRLVRMVDSDVMSVENRENCADVQMRVSERRVVWGLLLDVKCTLEEIQSGSVTSSLFVVTS